MPARRVYWKASAQIMYLRLWMPLRAPSIQQLHLIIPEGELSMTKLSRFHLVLACLSIVLLIAAE